MLTRSNFESGKAVYELNEGQHHDHLVCLDCGRVEEFFDAEIEKRQQMVAKTRGFVLAGTRAVALRQLHQDRLPAQGPLTPGLKRSFAAGHGRAVA